jgi:hypothetical protein
VEQTGQFGAVVDESIPILLEDFATAEHVVEEEEEEDA